MGGCLGGVRMSLSVVLARVWDVCFYVWFGSEIWIAFATRTRRGGGEVKDRGTLLLLWVVIGGSIAAAIWMGAARGRDILPGHRDGVMTVALGCLLAGLAIRWIAVVSLGESFSSNVAIHATQTVCKSGFYRWLRHPSYTGLLLCLVAVGIHAGSWLGLGVILVPTTCALLYRIHVEETALRGAFGEEYVQYSSGTRRLIPWVY